MGSVGGMLRSDGGLLGFRLGSVWGPFGVHLGSVWGPFGVHYLIISITLYYCSGYCSTFCMTILCLLVCHFQFSKGLSQDKFQDSQKVHQIDNL